MDTANHLVSDLLLDLHFKMLISEQDHVTYPVGNLDSAGSLFFAPGSCPSTHPVRLPLIFTETVWNTAVFNDLWPTDGSQPFVFSMGDP